MGGGSVFNMKAGATFAVTFEWTDDDGAPASLEGATIRATLRDGADQVAAECAVSLADQDLTPGRFTVQVDATTSSAWAPGTLVGDVRIERGGEVDYLEDFAVNVLRSRTRAT